MMPTNPMAKSEAYVTMGTLCDEPNELTCSMYVAKNSGRAAKVRPYATFEQAAAAVKSGESQAFLVPGAYPEIRYFIMDKDLEAREVFLMKIPDLVLVGTTKEQPLEVSTIFHHPATEPLLSELNLKFDENIFVTSNSKACVALLDKPANVAITNSLCAAHYQLSVYKVLRPGIVMPFVCFVKAA